MPSLSDFRVINGDIGGGFGMKTGLAPEDALVCYAARKLGRPVKWRAERAEEFLAAHMARDQHYRAALALDREGRILALRMEMLANIGAVPVGSSAMIPLAMVAKVATSAYRVPAVDYRIKGVLTNTMATGAYRGAGRPEGNYLIERLLEKAAREMRIDRVELRRRNLLKPDELPYKTHVGEIYDSGEFERMLSGALEAADWNGFEKRFQESKKQGKLRGRGVAVYLEWTGALPTETVDIEIGADGTVSVFSGTQAMGQGLETTYVQLVEEVLGVPVGKIKIVQGDTDRANGVGSVGSRSAFVGGSAVVAAGRKAVLRLQELAAEALEAAPGDIELGGGPPAHLRHRPLDFLCRPGCAPADQGDPRCRDANALDALVAERGAGGGGGDRPRDGGGRAGAALELRRHRAHHQPRDRRGADPRRHGARRGPGAVGAGALRRGQRPARCRARSWTTACRAPTSCRRCRRASTKACLARRTCWA